MLSWHSCASSSQPTGQSQLLTARQQKQNGCAMGNVPSEVEHIGSVKHVLWMYTVVMAMDFILAVVYCNHAGALGDSMQI